MKYTIEAEKGSQLSIQLDVAKIKSEFAKMGIKEFPSDYVTTQFKGDIKEFNQWITRMRNTWYKFTVGEDSIKVFEKALEDAKKDSKVG